MQRSNENGDENERMQENEEKINKGVDYDETANLGEYTLNMMPDVNSNGRQSEISSVWYCRTS